MAKQVDVYREWLGIQDAARPLSYYQLLRLKQFEDNAEKVREHYRRMNAHVRKYAAGEYAQQSQELLNELARAMLCLTDAQRKGEYDATLGREQTGDGKRPTLEQLLLQRKIVDAAQLGKARSYAAAIGVEVRDALIQQKLAKPEAVLPAYAESVGLPFLDLADIELDPELLRKVPPTLARQHSLAPVIADKGQVLIASPNILDPHAEEELRLRFGMPVRTVLCTPANIHDVIAKFYSRGAAAEEQAAQSAGGTAAKRGEMPAPGDAAKPKKAGAPIDVKARQKIALITFNFSFMIAMFGQLFFGRAGGKMSHQLGISLLVALLATSIAWMLAPKLQK